MKNLSYNFRYLKFLKSGALWVWLARLGHFTVYIYIYMYILGRGWSHFFLNISIWKNYCQIYCKPLIYTYIYTVKCPKRANHTQSAPLFKNFKYLKLYDRFFITDGSTFYKAYQALYMRKNWIGETFCWTCFIWI